MNVKNNGGNMEQMGSTAETWESPLFKKSRSIKTDMNRKQLTLIITAGYSGNVVASKLLDLIVNVKPSAKL